MSPTTYAVPFFALVCAACATTSTPKPLTSLPTPPEFASTSAEASQPPVAGDIEFTVAAHEVKAKAAPEDETVSTLRADKASADHSKQHVHAAQ